MNILLIEDDVDLAGTLIQYLELAGYSCDHAADGLRGLNLLHRNHYDVLILDIMLPLLNGLQVCRDLREAGNDIPVLMLTARDTLTDKLEGFRAGTDDYLVKPFACEELTMRLEALGRRRSGQVRKLQFADLVADLDQHTVHRGELEIKLTPTGWKLLETLLRASPSAVSRTLLEHAVWGDNPPESNALKVHMHHLRKAVDPANLPSLIHTVSGHGFQLRNPDDDQA